MTAEIIVANSNAIALAADSAVTIGSQKIYNSALKLFALSKVEPVGIMIYGNANLSGVPWELLIKSFRKHLGSKEEKTIEKYGRHFLRYLSENGKFFPDTVQNEWMTSNVQGYYSLIRGNLIEEVRKQEENKKEINEKTIGLILKKLINSEHIKLKKTKPIYGIDKEFEQHLRKQKLSLFKKIRNNIFENIALAKNMVKQLNDIAVFVTTRDVFPDNSSGIVIAGYGSDEIYPSVITYTIDGVVNNRIKYKKVKDKSVNIEDAKAAIIPFAQEDMVSTFMNGIDPNLLNLMESYLNQLFKRLPELLNSEKLFKEDGSEIETDKFQKDISTLLKDFFKKLGVAIDKASHPVVSMVSVLPKDELATMVETLINLTAFKRRMTNSLETVGGPVDVAIISKGDGFVWVKRKHYFPKELNYQFYKNYFMGGQYEK